MWQSTAVETGRWFASNGNFQAFSTTIDGTSAGGAQRYATRFQVEVPQGSVILNAQLTYPVTSGITSMTAETYAFDLDDVPAMQDAPVAGPFTAAVPAATGSPRIADVTDIVQQIVNRPGWTEGNSIAFLLRHLLSSQSTTYSRDVTLDVQWEPNVQELDPVTIFVPAYVGAIEPSYSITPATVGVPVAVGAVEVIAPRSLAPVTITVPVTVGATITRGTGHAPPLDQAHTITVGVTVGVPFLSATAPPPPPPIPWRTLVASPAYTQALAGREWITDARAEILNPDGATIATLGGPDATHPGLVSGTVTCRGSNEIRWECDLTINNADLVPQSHGDLLHPLSLNRIRIWWRIQLPDGTWGEVPVGTYYPDWPTVADTGDGDLAVSVRGSDPVAEVKQSTFRDPVQVGGMRAHEAVAAILETVAPWATTSLAPSAHTLPEEWEAGQPGGDPIKDITDIAAAAGMVFYADRMGTLVLEPEPAIGPPVEQFTEGPGCAMVEVSAEVDMGAVLNSVTVASTATTDADGNDIEPITATAVDDDPTSPLWVDRPHQHIRHRRVETDEITTQGQAEEYARRILDEARALIDRVELVHFARPHLDPGDVVGVNADRARISGPRQILDWSLALGDLSGQRTTTVGRRGLV